MRTVFWATLAIVFGLSPFLATGNGEILPEVCVGSYAKIGGETGPRQLADAGTRDAAEGAEILDPWVTALKIPKLRNFAIPGAANRAMRQELSQKGLSDDQVEQFMAILTKKGKAVQDNDLAEALVRGLTPERLSSPQSQRIAAYALRNLVNFHKKGDVDLVRAVTLLNTWDNQELASLARMYEEAGQLLLKDSSLTRDSAMSRVLERFGVPEETVLRLRKCSILNIA